MGGKHAGGLCRQPARAGADGGGRRHRSGRSGGPRHRRRAAAQRRCRQGGVRSAVGRAGAGPPAGGGRRRTQALSCRCPRGSGGCSIVRRSWRWRHPWQRSRSVSAPAPGRRRPAAAFDWPDPAAIRKSGQYEAALYQALEDSNPGTQVAYADAAEGRRGTVTIVGPIIAGVGGDCLEFRREWSDADNRIMSRGLACRSDTGEWSVLSMPPKPAS